MSITVASGPDVIQGSVPDICDAGPLTLEMYHTFDDVAPLREQWDAFVQRCNGVIYQTFDWCRIWWKYYGHRRALRLVVIRQGEEWVALFPMFIDKIGVWPCSIRVAKAISTEFSTSRFAPMVRPEFQPVVASLLCQQLLIKERCQLISIGPMVNAESFASAFEHSEDAERLNISRRASDAVVLMSFDFRGGFDGLLGQISSGRRANLRRAMRQVENRDGVVVDRIVDAARLDNEFDAFCELHRQRWVADGKQGHFDDWPAAKAFHRELAVCHAAAGRTRLYKITCHEELIAYEYGYCLGHTYFWLMPGRTTSEEWERLSIGQVSSLIQMRMEAADGVTDADLGQGFYDYKKSMGASSHNLEQVSVSLRDRRLDRLKILCWQKISQLLHLAYYKLWFLRLRPKFQLPPRSLWSFWIRTRF